MSHSVIARQVRPRTARRSKSNFNLEGVVFVHAAAFLLIHWVKDWVITCSLNGLVGALRKMQALFNDSSGFIAQINSNIAP